MNPSVAMAENNARLHVLDFLRGIAVLGIFVINIESFAYANSFSPWQFGFASDLDRDFRFWTYLFFQGKFFSMFALLFGVGFYLFLEKAGKFGRHAVDLYAHRMFWLFVFGVLHASLLWPGDILYHYAVCGLLLLPARSLRLWQLASCIIALTILIGWQSVASTMVLSDKQAVYEAAAAVPAVQRSPAQSDAVERWEKRYAPRKAATPDENSPRLGNYTDNIVANIEAVSVADGQIYYRGILFRTLLLMLVGILLFRLGVFHDYRKLPGYWIVTTSLLALGITANYSRHWSWTYEYFVPITNYGTVLAHEFSKESLGIAYVLLLNGIFQKCLRLVAFNPIASVGRMALTNYLFQSVAAGFVFYGYGVGLHGSLDRSELWPIIILVWGLQLAFSIVWSRRFRQGPMEALWRWLMYSTAMPGSKEKVQDKDAGTSTAKFL